MFKMSGYVELNHKPVGGTNTYFNSWSVSSSTSPLVIPGVTWTIYGQSSTTLVVSPDGWMSTSAQNLNNPAIQTALSSAHNNDTAPYSFPNTFLPPYLVAPFYTYGSVLPETQQGTHPCSAVPS